jgi:hypothetical protein
VSFGEWTGEVVSAPHRFTGLPQLTALLHGENASLVITAALIDANPSNPLASRDSFLRLIEENLRPFPE